MGFEPAAGASASSKLNVSNGVVNGEVVCHSGGESLSTSEQANKDENVTVVGLLECMFIPL